MSTRIGFIGLGIIGLPMAERLLAQGVALAVWNRTPEKAQALAPRGATVAASPRELAARCDVVVTMVSDGPALRELVHRADGIAAGLAAGCVHLDMSTIDPGTSADLAAFYAARGAHFVHAPVLGNRRHAAAGELLIFAGGAAAARGQFARRSRDGCAAWGQRLCLLRRAVPYRQRHALSEKPLGHRQPDDAEPDESNSCGHTSASVTCASGGSETS